mmetsp:Transcript_74550/g.198841  ORF Transcript_74550/g.198841 Transcript_74550/m.198841 type:complete len:252 (+) Transcript_74550:818-1573(+)
MLARWRCRSSSVDSTCRLSHISKILQFSACCLSSLITGAWARRIGSRRMGSSILAPLRQRRRRSRASVAWVSKSLARLTRASAVSLPQYRKQTATVAVTSVFRNPAAASRNLCRWPTARSHVFFRHRSYSWRRCPLNVPTMRCSTCRPSRGISDAAAGNDSTVGGPTSFLLVGCSDGDKSAFLGRTGNEADSQIRFTTASSRPVKQGSLLSPRACKLGSESACRGFLGRPFEDRKTGPWQPCCRSSFFMAA